jgi:3-hydroxymyristoyl/3-hydroxydecanoyl-(acyl carrier protein) dehydratase
MLKYSIPELVTTEHRNLTLKMTFRVPESYPYFEGHFAGNPLVPAVTQIGWVLCGIFELVKKEPQNYHISRFKFLAPILPNNEVVVEIVEQGNHFRCQLSVDGQLRSKGLVVIEAND